MDVRSRLILAKKFENYLKVFENPNVVVSNELCYGKSLVNTLPLLIPPPPPGIFRKASAS